MTPIKFRLGAAHTKLGLSNMQRMLILMSAAATLVYASGAAAAPPQLKGQYAFTGSAGCLVSAPLITGAGGGFDALLQPNPGSRVFSENFTVEGIRTFNGDGTGAVNATSVGMVPPPIIIYPTSGNVMFPPTALPSANKTTFSFSFTYTVDEDSFSSELVPGTFVGHVERGPRTGQSYTIDTLPFYGLIANENKSLTVATVEPVVETVQYSNGDTHSRICNRSRSLFWLGIEAK
jgi:hypothetical protein